MKRELKVMTGIQTAVTAELAAAPLSLLSPRSMAQQIEAWFLARGWQVLPFQRAAWQAAVAGQSGLLHATTGSGKTNALWLAALLRCAARPLLKGAGLRVLWITPMRALAADTLRALQESASELAPTWRLEARTGDTTPGVRARQAKRLPELLITTPESLTVLLSKADARHQFAQLDMVIVDEWHELLGNKRGVQTQLALARLRHWQPPLLVWGLSATLGNLAQALEVLLGGASGVIIEGKIDKDIIIDTLIPAALSRFPWSGHLGLQMLPAVMAEIDAESSTLVFTNTRAQAESWYQNLLAARPDWAGLIALHHGSLDKGVRDWVEKSLKLGQLKAVICTSSLDLGVDFLPVQRVLQIGSVKGVARLIQRAGRSGHAPGRVARLTLVPTHSLELLEAAAAKTALAQKQIEARLAPNKPLDCLVQHLVTLALGGGFRSEQLLLEVRSAWSYRELSLDEWQWALDFVVRGGQSLTVYPEYQRVVADEEGVYRVPDAALGRRHRLSIGTIVADATIQVQFIRGGKIGSIEEGFIARLKQGDHFLFGGRMLELVRVHEMTAYVRRAKGNKGAVPRWQGGKMALSSELAQAALEQLRQASLGRYEGLEMQALQPLLALQQRCSFLPTSTQLVIECMRSNEGQHLFMYPLAGRAVHQGLAALLAYRVARLQPATFSMAVNDYGFELMGSEEVNWAGLFGATAGCAPNQPIALFSTDDLLADVLASLNASQLAQRRFREIARIAGLVFQGFPGQAKSARQLQASAALFFEVFRKHDSSNLLLTQAQREVLEHELELTRLRQTLSDLSRRSVAFCQIERATPFGFGLMVERYREKLTTEKLSTQVARIVRELEKSAQP